MHWLRGIREGLSIRNDLESRSRAWPNEEVGRVGGGVLGRGAFKTNNPEVSEKSLGGGSIQLEFRVFLGSGRWQWRLLTRYMGEQSPDSGSGCRKKRCELKGDSEIGSVE